VGLTLSLLSLFSLAGRCQNIANKARIEPIENLIHSNDTKNLVLGGCVLVWPVRAWSHNNNMLINAANEIAHTHKGSGEPSIMALF
jgi:hypothetical protein